MSKSMLSLVGGAKDTPTFNVGALNPNSFRGRACVISLGCAKNQVDSEVMLGALAKGGYEIVTDSSEAELIIVNTCGFLESAVKEGIDRILEAAELKSKGRCKQILVAGCMVERYRTELQESLPEVDKFVSVDEILSVADIASGKLDSVLDRAGRPYFLYDDTMPRFLSTRGHTAYVKIAEGCNRPCTFCIIPKLRGAMRSRSLDSVVREVESLGQQGVKEVNLIAQDLTSYGIDSKGPRLVELLHALDKTGAVDWIRLLYAYPVGTDLELISAIADLPSVVEYYDIPLQHSHESVLKQMKRPLGKFSPRSIVEMIKKAAPSVHIRTTFIVGFPGETEEHIQDLEQFVSEGHFTNLGVFQYSPEPSTPAMDLVDQVPQEVKKERYNRIMKAQQGVVNKRQKEFLGQTLEVLIDGTHSDTDLLLSGRTRFQAPDIDGSVIINDLAPNLVSPQVGHKGTVRVTEIAGYDLVGRLES